MKPEILFFDCAGTLLYPAESIGEVYARTAAGFGLQRDAVETERRFRQAWRRASWPSYPCGPDEKVDFDWWRELVREALDLPLPGPGLRPSQVAETRPTPSPEAGKPSKHLFAPGDFEACFAALFQHYAQPAAWRLFPDVLPTLQSLHGKVRLGILSNFDARLHSLLGGHGLRGFFNPVILSSESAACKPDTAIFRHAATSAGLPPESCLLAGDDPVNDWQGAAKAGWRVFQLQRPANSLRDLVHLQE